MLQKGAKNKFIVPTLVKTINVKSKVWIMLSLGVHDVYPAFIYIIGETHLSVSFLISIHKLVSFRILLVWLLLPLCAIIIHLWSITYMCVYILTPWDWEERLKDYSANGILNSIKLFFFFSSIPIFQIFIFFLIDT